MLLPFIVLAELRAGFVVGSKSAQNEQILSLFLTKPSVSIIYPDVQTIAHYADLFRQLRKAGRKIPTNDLWLAAIVVQHGLTLASRDAHFDHLPQIPRASM